MPRFDVENALVECRMEMQDGILAAAFVGGEYRERWSHSGFHGFERADG